MTKLIKSKIEVEGRLEDRYAIVEQQQTTDWDIEEQLDVVGKPIVRVDAVQRVTGAAKFTVDVKLPGMLHAKFLRSPHAHARIVQIDSTKAKQLPGVIDVLTYRDLLAIEFEQGRPLLGDVVRFAGDEVAAILATTDQVARQGLKHIRVDYEVLPFVLEAEEGAKPDAPRVHASGNILGGSPSHYERGDFEASWSEVQVVVEGAFQTPTQLHNALETHSTVANWDGQILTIWDSTQNLYGVRDQVAEILRIDRHHVHVISEYMGGGLGSKNVVGKHTLMAALLTRRFRRPVRFVLDRTEENIVGGNRPSTRQYLKIGAKRDGTLVAIGLTCYIALGAYASWSPSVGGPVRELYGCPNVRTTEYGVFTNTGPFSAFRAPGYVEGTFSLEVLMDELAEQLKLDPLELRIKNYARCSPSIGLTYSSNGLLDTYEVGAREISWSRRIRPAEQRGNTRTGIGMASQIWVGGGGPPSYGLVRINSDGTATVVTGTQDLGTGTKTALSQIASEELGLPVAKVSVEIGNTQFGVYSTPSWSSSTLASVGPAVREAAADAKQQLLQLAARYLKKRRKSLKIMNGIIHGPKVEMALSEMIRQLGDISIVGRGSRAPNPEEYVIRTFGASFAEVAVDIETGEIHINKMIAAHDSGRIINPLTASSQVEGAVIQGLGFALLEERICDPLTGVVLNANLEGYHLPTIMDSPKIEARMIDRADSIVNNLGSKGIGEPPIIATPAAIVNAIYHATGLRFHTLPLTRDRLLEALAAPE